MLQTLKLLNEVQYTIVTGYQETMMHCHLGACSRAEVAFCLSAHASLAYSLWRFATKPESQRKVIIIMAKNDVGVGLAKSVIAKKRKFNFRHVSKAEFHFLAAHCFSAILAFVLHIVYHFQSFPCIPFRFDSIRIVDLN